VGFDFAEDYGRNGGGEAGSGEEFGFGSALLELGYEEVGVTALGGGVGCDVGDGEELLELLDEFGLAWGGVGAGGLWGRCLGGERKGRRDDG
jgi:hypothetical protein